MNLDANSYYSTKLQLKNFDIGKYNELYKYSTSPYAGVINVTQYVKNLQDCVTDYEGKKMFVNEIKDRWN